MKLRRWLQLTAVTLMMLGVCKTTTGQQKPQWMPGQMGLNAGVQPSSGFSYVNMDVNYDAGSFNGPKGEALPVTGSYNVWAVENIFIYVTDTKILGGHFGFQVMFPTIANGSLVADFQVPNQGSTNLGLSGGGTGLADLWLQPFTLGWHMKRLDFTVGDAFMVPTGRYSPGATNNIGSGYFGNHLETGSTLYLTKNKGTSANLFTDWELHGPRQGTNSTFKTPGQAFTVEWGLGQVLPLKKDFSKLLQVGVIGYDQWQITDNGGTIPLGPLVIPASGLPRYSVHAVGGQLTYILPAKNLSFFFKYEHEYKSDSHTLGNTLVFGGAWTLRIPKPTPPAN